MSGVVGVPGRERGHVLLTTVLVKVTKSQSTAWMVMIQVLVDRGVPGDHVLKAPPAHRYGLKSVA